VVQRESVAVGGHQNVKDPYKVINEHQPFGYVFKDGDIKKLLEAVDTAVRIYKLIVENRRLIKVLQGKKRAI
jgi:hypothetical protein